MKSADTQPAGLLQNFTEKILFLVGLVLYLKICYFFKKYVIEENYSNWNLKLIYQIERHQPFFQHHFFKMYIF